KGIILPEMENGSDSKDTEAITIGKDPVETSNGQSTSLPCLGFTLFTVMVLTTGNLNRFIN
ncbi:MAG: hypothetical protein PVF18_10520, partial [Anaerolineales bacterium]